MLVTSLAHARRVLANYEPSFEKFPLKRRYLIVDTEGQAKKGYRNDDVLVYDRAACRVFSIAFFGQHYSFATSLVDAKFPTALQYGELLKPFFKDPRITIVVHNWIYDAWVLSTELGLPLPPSIWCTLVSSWMGAEYLPKGLKDRALRYGRVLRDTFKVDFSSLTELADYAEEDVIQTEEMFWYQRYGKLFRTRSVRLVSPTGFKTKTNKLPLSPAIPKDEILDEFRRNWLLLQEFPVIRSNVHAQRLGFPYDYVAHLTTQKNVLDAQAAALKTIYGLAGRVFNTNSTAELTQVCQDLGINNPHKTKKGAAAFNAKARSKLEASSGHPFFTSLRTAKELAKMIAVYIGEKSFDVTKPHNDPANADTGLAYFVNLRTGSIHATVNTVGAITGRSSSCVSGDTLLPTSRGTFRFDEYLPESGDFVVSHTRSICRVLRKVFKGKFPMYLVKLKNGSSLKCTMEHRVLSAKGWRKLAELAVGDKVMAYEFEQDTPSLSGNEEKSLCCLPSANTSVELHGRSSLRDKPCNSGQNSSEYLEPRRVRSAEGASVLQEQAGIKEPYEGQEWFPSPQLHRGGERRTWVSPEESEREVHPVPSTNTLAVTGFNKSSEGFCDSSYRRGQDQQSQGQPLSLNDWRASFPTCEEVQISEISALGTMGVWDVEIEGDHSYRAQGFINHNSNPNLQQIPSRKDAFGIKNLFVANRHKEDDYVLIVLDHSQLEIRVMGLLSQDPEITRILSDPKGDIHQNTADKFSVQRDPYAKNLNFLLLYGGEEYMLSEALTFVGAPTTVQQAGAYRQMYNQVHYRVPEYRQELLQFHQENDYIELWCHRQRHLPGVDWADKYQIHKAETTLSNNVVQGCLEGKTKLLTEHGLVSIVEFMQTTKTAKVASKIWSGEKWETVTNVFSVGKKPLWEVRLSDGSTFKTSDTHLWKNELGEWVKTSTLKFGDYVQQSVVCCPKKLTTGYSLAEAEFVGLMVGDGSYSYREITLVCKKDPLIAKHEARILTSSFGEESWTVQRGSKNRFYLRSAHGERARMLGLTANALAHSKTVPDWLFSASRSHRRAFIRGYYLTDGGTSVRCVTFTSVSRSLLEGTQTILYSLGIRSSLKRFEKRNENEQDYYRLFISPESKAVLYDIVKLVPCSKTNRLQEVATESLTNKGNCLPPRLAKFVASEWQKTFTFIKSPSKEYYRRQAMLAKLRKGTGSLDFARKLPLSRSTLDLVSKTFLTVVSVKDCCQKVEMFDLTVEPSHQYAAWNGVIMHNSGQDFLKAGIVRLDTSNVNPDTAALQMLSGSKSWRNYIADKSRILEKYRRTLRLAQCRYLLQIHDELVFRVRKEAASECLRICAQVMSWRHYFPTRNKYTIPLVAEGGTGLTWKHAKSKPDGKTPPFDHYKFGEYDKLEN